MENYNDILGAVLIMTLKIHIDVKFYSIPIYHFLMCVQWQPTINIAIIIPLISQIDLKVMKSFALELFQSVEVNR